LVLFRVYDREEALRRNLGEQTDGHADLLDERVRRTDTHIGLAADDRLRREILVIQDNQLDVYPALLGPFDCGKRLYGFDAGQVAEGNAHVAGAGGFHRYREAQRRGKSCCKHNTSGQASHCSFLPMVYNQSWQWLETISELVKENPRSI